MGDGAEVGEQATEIDEGLARAGVRVRQLNQTHGRAERAIDLPVKGCVVQHLASVVSINGDSTAVRESAVQG